MDTTLIGELAAKLMEELPAEVPEEAEIVACGLVVVVDADNSTYTRIKCHDDALYVQLGLFYSAIEVATSGDNPHDTD